MRPLRLILFAAAALVAVRALSRRAGPARLAFWRIVALGGSHTPHIASDGSTEATSVPHGEHSSAAAAANHDFYDDRDVAVGEKLSAVGMQPGAR
jgi:hypothetical protein